MQASRQTITRQEENSHGRRKGVGWGSPEEGHSEGGHELTRCGQGAGWPVRWRGGVAWVGGRQLIQSGCREGDAGGKAGGDKQEPVPCTGPFPLPLRSLECILNAVGALQVFQAEQRHHHTGTLEAPCGRPAPNGVGVGPQGAFSILCSGPHSFCPSQEQGQKLRKTMLELEKQGLEAMEEILTSSDPLDPAEVGDLFYDCVDTEIKFFK